MENTIPLYRIVLNEDSEQGLDFISLVDEPAILEKGLAFASHQVFVKPTAGEDKDTFIQRCIPVLINEGKDQEQAAAICYSYWDDKESYEAKFQFKKQKDKQVVVGPAMIPDLPIRRFDSNFGEYYVVFTADVIEKLVERFNKNTKQYKINVDHDTIVKSAFVKSNWIIEDKTNDKSNFYGFDLPVGTSMVEVKIEDENFWTSEVKDNAKFGFSVEGWFGLEFDKMINNKFFKKEEKMKLNDIKLALADLTPEEVAELQTAIAEVAPAEVVAEVTEAVVEVVEEQMNEGIAEEEVDAKYDELMIMIAEVKAMVEGSELPAPAEVVEAKADKFSNQLDLLAKLRRIA